MNPPPRPLPYGVGGRGTARVPKSTDAVDYPRRMITDTLTLPSYDGAEVVVPAPAAGPGNWAGAAGFC